jgi:hypothetical protein
MPDAHKWFYARRSLFRSMIDWVGLLLFDIGNPLLEVIPTNLRVLNGFLQATSVRCGGVTSVSISGLVPAAQYVYRSPNIFIAISPSNIENS